MSKDALILAYVLGLPFLWALVVGFDVAKRLGTSPGSQLKAAGHFLIGVLVVPLMQLMLVVVSMKILETTGHRVTAGSVWRLMTLLSLPLACAFIWSALSVPLFAFLVHLRRQTVKVRPFGRRASDRFRQRPLTLARA